MLKMGTNPFLALTKTPAPNCWPVALIENYSIIYLASRSSSMLTPVQFCCLGWIRKNFLGVSDHRIEMYLAIKQNHLPIHVSQDCWSFLLIV